MRISATGNVSIGTTTTSYLLQLGSDSAGKPTSSTWTISSDERVKTNIQPVSLDKCYEIIENLPLKEFEYKEKYFPQLKEEERKVKKNKHTFTMEDGEEEVIEDFRSLDMDQMNKYLIGAVQKLMRRVDELEKRLNEK